MTFPGRRRARWAVARSIRAPGGARRRRSRGAGAQTATSWRRSGAARRPAARARAADRIPAPDPGPGGLPAGGTSAGAGRGAQDPDGGGLRGRHLLCALRCGGRRRGAAADGHDARVRQPELHAGRRRGAAARRCRPRSCRACGSCARLASAHATQRPRPRSATATSIMRRRPRSRNSRCAGTCIRICRPTRTSTLT